jgi:hypothetical protein
MVVGLGEVYGDGKDHDGALRMPFAFSTNRGRRSHQLGGSTKVMTRQVNSACAAELGRVGAVSSLLSSCLAGGGGEKQRWGFYFFL